MEQGVRAPAVSVLSLLLCLSSSLTLPCLPQRPFSWTWDLAGEEKQMERGCWEGERIVETLQIHTEQQVKFSVTLMGPSSYARLNCSLISADSHRNALAVFFPPI